MTSSTPLPPPSPLHAAFDTIVRAQYEVAHVDLHQWCVYPVGRPDRLIAALGTREAAVTHLEHLVASKVAPLLSAVEILGRVGYTAIPKG